MREQNGMREFLGMMDMFRVLIAVMVSWAGLREGPNLTFSQVSATVFALGSNNGIFHESHTWLPYNAHSIHCFDGNITNPFCEKPMIFAPKNSIKEDMKLWERNNQIVHPEWS